MKAWPNAGGLKSDSRATVYFARRGPYVKIGISRDPAKRIRQLRYGRCITPPDADRAEPIRLLHTVPNSSLEDELLMQFRFNRWLVAGEWFRYDASFAHELTAVINESRLLADTG